MTQLVASLVERSIDQLAEASKAAYEAGADLVEIRLDHLESASDEMISMARKAVLGPAIATLRSSDEGGRSSLGRTARENKLRFVAGCDFEFVDLELDRDGALLSEIGEEEPRPVTIASKHFRRPVGRAAVERALTRACAAADIGKVAMPCDHAAHALMLAQVGLRFSRANRRFVLVGMGQQGQLTRVCAREIGSALAYACLPGRQAAPGQLDIAAQRRLLDDSKLLLGLLGHPVSHSVSKPMQEAAMERASLTGVYLPLDFPPEHLNRLALRTLGRLGFAGVNVTIPHKAWAFRNSSRRGPAAAATGAANTLIFGKRTIAGENTDVYGFARLLEGKKDITHSTKVLLVGAGGAARAVAYVLRERGAKLTVTDKEMDRARRLARDFGARAVRLGQVRKEKVYFDLVINCTPMGMKGVSDESPVGPEFFDESNVLIDIVFNPPVTATMRLAGSKGARAYGGLEMLVQQGAESFRLWTGIEPDVDAMREAARRALA